MSTATEQSIGVPLGAGTTSSHTASSLLLVSIATRPALIALMKVGELREGVNKQLINRTPSLDSWKVSTSIRGIYI